MLDADAEGNGFEGPILTDGLVQDRQLFGGLERQLTQVAGVIELVWGQWFDAWHPQGSSENRTLGTVAGSVRIGPIRGNRE